MGANIFLIVAPWAVYKMENFSIWNTTWRNIRRLLYPFYKPKCGLASHGSRLLIEHGCLSILCVFSPVFCTKYCKIYQHRLKYIKHDQTSPFIDGYAPWLMFYKREIYILDISILNKVSVSPSNLPTFILWKPFSRQHI
jgi:hypothetical protein